jgi:hypothetical protein
MVAFLTRILGPYLLPVVAAAAFAAGIVAAGSVGKLYLDWWHDPAIRRDALKGYVAEAQLAAVQAKLDEMQRQKTAAEYAHAAFTRQAAADHAKAAAETIQLQQENDAYAAALRAQNRACPLDADDLRNIMR